MVRTGVWIALLLYGLLAIGSGLDRAAAERDFAGKWVPTAFRAQADLRFARRLIEAGIPRNAVIPATAGLSASPLDPASSANLAVARLAGGDRSGAEAAFRVSAKLGWREPLTQLFWQQVALDEGDWRRASLRFDALARQYPASPAVAQSAALFEASPAGRSALARQIARGAHWLPEYAQVPQGVSPAAQGLRAEVLSETARLGRSLGCDPVAPLVRALAASDPHSAASLWRSHCADADAVGAVFDPALHHLRFAGPRTPFEWEMAGHGSLEIDAVAGGGISLRSSAAIAVPVLAQMVALQPGTYRVSWRSQPAARFRATLGCGRVNAPAAGPQTGQFVVAVGAQCAGQWLQIWLTPGGSMATLDAVSIERL